MKVKEDKCTGCYRCIPYCPVGAILMKEYCVEINQDTCVECGACLRSGVCKSGALYMPSLKWPRILREEFSNPLATHSTTKRRGRGTEEMKTNDVTGKYREGVVGFCIELGRPGVGTSFSDVERVTIALAGLLEFEPDNPVTFLIDPETGRLKDEKVRNERVLSCIVEGQTTTDKAIEVVRKLQEVSKTLDTVFCIGVISRCRGGKVPIKSLLDEAGIDVSINGKTCIGLGRPLHDA